MTKNKCICDTCENNLTEIEPNPNNIVWCKKEGTDINATIGPNDFDVVKGGELGSSCPRFWEDRKSS